MKRSIPEQIEPGPFSLTWWLIESHGKRGEQITHLQPLAIRLNGARLPAWERLEKAMSHRAPGRPSLDTNQRALLLREHLEPMLYRELQYRGLVKDNGGFSAKLIGWVEVSYAYDLRFRPQIARLDTPTS